MVHRTEIKIYCKGLRVSTRSVCNGFKHVVLDNSTFDSFFLPIDYLFSNSMKGKIECYLAIAGYLYKMQF